MRCGLGMLADIPGRTPAARRFRSGASAILMGLLLSTNVAGQAPEITQQPIDQLVAIGGDATFRVVATGIAPLTYQWRFNSRDLAGANGATLRITKIQPDRAGSYSVVVTNVNGSTTSQPATLTVDPEWVLYHRANSGLPYNGVVDVEVDPDGKVWIATGRWGGHDGGGLAEFNGHTWTIFRSGSSPLPDYDCTGLALDTKGDLWVSTETGLARFDRIKEWTVVSRSQFWFPKFDLKGNLWVGSGSGVWVYDGANWRCYQMANSGLPNDFVAYVCVDAENRKWISTHGGLAVFDDPHWTVYKHANSGLPNDTVAPIAFDEQGIAWIGTWGGGLARFDGTQWIVYNPANSGLPNANIEDVAIDSKGVKWIATEGGLARFDGMNWRTWNRANSRLPDNILQALVFDRYENLWLGMRDGGVAVFRQDGVIPHLLIGSLTGDGAGRLVLRWTGGQSPYQVQTCANLGTGEWEACGDSTDQQSLTIEVEAGPKFFRVRGSEP